MAAAQTIPRTGADHFLVPLTYGSLQTLPRNFGFSYTSKNVWRRSDMTELLWGRSTGMVQE